MMLICTWKQNKQKTQNKKWSVNQVIIYVIIYVTDQLDYGHYEYPYFLSYVNDYSIVYELLKLSEFVIQFNKTFISYDIQN